MDVQHAAYLFAIAVGFDLRRHHVGSLVGHRHGRGAPARRLALMPIPHCSRPCACLAIIFAAPVTVLLTAFHDLIERPILGVPVFAAALGWSFLQGVFILTQVFGIT
jgi:hypothetical protein